MSRGGQAAADDDSSVDVADVKPDIIGDDKIVTDDTTTHNEWIAAQGLVSLSDDQPSHGSIHKIHKKMSETESQDNVSKSQSDVVTKDKVIDSD